jgi:hypothetical protein
MSTTIEQINFLTHQISILEADILQAEQNIHNAKSTIALMKDARRSLEAVRAQEKLTDGIENVLSKPA